MMNTHIRTNLVGTAIGAVATLALLFLGAGTAHAIQDVSDCAPGITVGAFNPQQPDTRGIDHPGIHTTPRPPVHPMNAVRNVRA